MSKKEQDIFEKQYYHGGGFCGTCGKAIGPIKGFEKELGNCEVKGNHGKDTVRMPNISD